MILKHVLLFSVTLGLLSGCSDRIDASSDVKKKSVKSLNFVTEKCDVFVILFLIYGLTIIKGKRFRVAII